MRKAPKTRQQTSKSKRGKEKGYTVSRGTRRSTQNAAADNQPKLGRPTKLTPEVQARIVTGILQGATYEMAAQYGRITYSTFRSWMIAGEKEETPELSAFFEAIKGAEADAVVVWLSRIQTAAANGEWQAAAWKLERRYPQTYGRKVHELQGKDGEQLIPIDAIRLAMENAGYNDVP